MAIQQLIRPEDIVRASKSFGTFGSAAIGRSNPIVVVVAANNNEPVTAQELKLNKPLVKMINVLASIDGFIKQRLDNQKTIEQNRILSDRESQVEQQPTQEVQVVQQDAERVGGSSAGLLALGGLALLTLDPVQAALKDMFDGVAAIGRFVTNIVSSINGAFEFLLGGAPAANAEAADVEQPSPRQGGVGVTPAAEPVEGNPPAPAPAATPTEQEQPSFLGSVTSGALTGASVGMLGGKRGSAIGAVIGGAVGAYNYMTGGGSTSSSSSTPSSTTATPAPPATGGATTPVTPSSTTSTTPTDATPTAGSTGNVVQVNHPETGSGWGIAGATDANGRPLAFSKEGAEAFAKMMQDSGGAVKPSDVASSKRSVAKNREVDGATNSPHLRGVAMDIHGTSGPWIRQHGHKYGWKPHDYAGTHGGHFVFGGPGLTPDEGAASESGIGSTIADIADAGLETIAKLFGTIGSAVIKPGVPRTDLGATISQAAKETNAEIAVAKTPKDPTPPPMPAPPRINKKEGGPTQNPPTMADRTSVYYYFERFGFNDLSRPEAALNK